MKTPPINCNTSFRSQQRYRYHAAREKPLHAIMTVRTKLLDSMVDTELMLGSIKQENRHSTITVALMCILHIHAFVAVRTANCTDPLSLC